MTTTDTIYATEKILNWLLAWLGVTRLQDFNFLYLDLLKNF